MVAPCSSFLGRPHRHAVQVLVVAIFEVERHLAALLHIAHWVDGNASHAKGDGTLDKLMVILGRAETQHNSLERLGEVERFLSGSHVARP